jgi:arsenate reductase
MGEAILRDINPELEVVSAGTKIADQVHPLAVKAMAEIGIDISSHYPKMVDEFLDEGVDYLISVCGGAKEACPAFLGPVGTRLHIGFDDPAYAEGSEEEIFNVFRRVRDEIRRDFAKFNEEYILSK